MGRLNILFPIMPTSDDAVETFGNAAHVILPKEFTGKVVRIEEI
jgi:hypothetical protein